MSWKDSDEEGYVELIPLTPEMKVLLRNESQEGHCDTCGEHVSVGGWPFCASERNSDGHARGVNYQFKIASHLRKWEKGRIA